ncbi:MAG: putative phosphothreonine lyase domain-containg protein [Streptosporangiaceae bacterium]
MDAEAVAERESWAKARWPAILNEWAAPQRAQRTVYRPRVEEVLVTNVSGLLPSQVTDDYWIYADSPAVSEADPSRTGKWLVFVPARQVDRWWELIRLATEQGRLGISAKAATARHNDLATSRRTKLICVYTRDWQDQSDVQRVLRQLRGIGVTSRLSYKTDEATVSGVYGTGSAIYVSQPGSAEFEDRTRRMHSLVTSGPGLAERFRCPAG